MLWPAAFPRRQWLVLLPPLHPAPLLNCVLPDLLPLLFLSSQVTLIDFTLSRLVTVTGEVAFCDLAADPELFRGPRNSVQAETYRRMKKATRNAWQAHVPATNVYWMQYLVDTCITEVGMGAAPLCVWSAGTGWGGGLRRPSLGGAQPCLLLGRQPCSHVLPRVFSL